ncbi:hypothetical protein [Leuconostoc citreum]|uniref:hypothetical protein n=1 Tax=Leuconostoc citreum TaxID=33964 RepID=UPI000246673B|nr:hypothetical protein [Leuconostoc citreum]CCF27637.1 Putative uncharacterized protein [Leuconostoc citreum LBAE C11]
MINHFEKIRLQGKSLGKLTFVSRDKVGTKSDIDVAVLNYNDSLSTVRVTPQAGFDFAKPFGTELKLINAFLTGGDARSNQRAGARVVTRNGTLLEMSESGQDEVPEAEFDAVFITGKEKTPFGRVRSADAFNSHDLVLFSVEANYQTDNRGVAIVDRDTNETTITNYQFNFVQESKSGQADNNDNFIRILVSPSESERIMPTLKRGAKLVPQGMQFAFVGNDVTDWTVYAETLVPLADDSKQAVKADDKQASTTSAKTDNKDVKK